MKRGDEVMDGIWGLACKSIGKYIPNGRKMCPRGVNTARGTKSLEQRWETFENIMEMSENRRKD
jgi:hypothetical protein